MLAMGVARGRGVRGFGSSVAPPVFDLLKDLNCLVSVDLHVLLEAAAFTRVI